LLIALNQRDAHPTKFGEIPRAPCAGARTRSACTHHLADLDPRFLVAGDHVGLNHDRHVGFEAHVRHRASGTAFGAEHRRPVTATEAVHDVIVDGETRVLDDAGSINNFLTGDAGAQHAGD
jgi:hypothetical protein